MQTISNGTAPYAVPLAQEDAATRRHEPPPHPYQDSRVSHESAPRLGMARAISGSHREGTAALGSLMGDVFGRVYAWWSPASSSRSRSSRNTMGIGLPGVSLWSGFLSRRGVTPPISTHACLAVRVQRRMQPSTSRSGSVGVAGMRMRVGICMHVHNCTICMFRAAECRKRDSHDTELRISDPASPKSYLVVRHEDYQHSTCSQCRCQACLLPTGTMLH